MPALGVLYSIGYP